MVKEQGKLLNLIPFYLPAMREWLERTSRLEDFCNKSIEEMISVAQNVFTFAAHGKLLQHFILKRTWFLFLVVTCREME